jgi:hypothetical protein
LPFLAAGALGPAAALAIGAAGAAIQTATLGSTPPERGFSLAGR